MPAIAGLLDEGGLVANARWRLPVAAFATCQFKPAAGTLRRKWLREAVVDRWVGG